MTDLQYQVLLKVKQYQPCSDDLFTREEHIILNTCSKEKWIKWTRTNLDIVLTELGQAAILEHEQLLKQQEQDRAEREAERAANRAYADENTQKQFKHDWRIAIFETFTGFMLGAIADHFLDIVGNAARLWLALKHVLFH